MNSQSGMKKILKFVIALAVIVLAVRWCSRSFGSVISLPGGSSGTGSGEESGGWFSPKGQDGGTAANGDVEVQFHTGLHGEENPFDHYEVYVFHGAA